MLENGLPEEGVVLPVDKPYCWTSADVVRKIKYAAKRWSGKKNLKVGHAGTLDPLATGILLVCIGPATRRAEALQASPKQYLAGVTFGATTPSYDLEKEIDSFYPLEGVSRESLEAALPGFLGEQDQVAPLFSAKSVDGVRAYETARRLLRQAQREGKAFDHSAAGELQTNRINIYGLELEDYSEGAGCGEDGCSGSFGPSLSLIPPTSWAPPAIKRGCLGSSESEHPSADSIPTCDSPADKRGCLGSSESEHPSATGRIHVADISSYSLPTAMIRVDCSKGTYIRALARDLGEALGSGAFLSSLRRTRNGGFDIDDAISLDEAVSLFEQ